MSEDKHSENRQVQQLILLVKKGDASSLLELRHKLGMTQNNLASILDVPISQLKQWEKGEESPSVIQHARWKLALSNVVDDKIGNLLCTSNKEIITQFWELLWTLNE